MKNNSKQFVSRVI